MNSHLLSQFFNVDEDHLLAPAADPFAPHQMWQHPNPSAYVKMEDSGDDASSNASWGFTSPMDYDPASPATTINCIPGGLAQISLPGSSRSPSPDMTLTLPGAFNFAAAAAAHPSHSATHPKAVTAIPAHLRANALNPSSLVSPPVIPTPLAQSSPKSNGRSAKVNPAPPSVAPSTAPSSPMMEHNLQLINGQPHPYSISPSNTTALFTRASSVASNPSAKKGRAPPSGPISTKDFIPPDVSGLTKREARLVKNRAAAFLSRQRKREEFEGLEARVEVLEADNARLYKELESYRSGAPTSSPSATASASGATPAALQAEVIGLRRQLSARDQELSKLHGRMQALNADANAERERSAQKDAEIAQLKRMLEQSKSAVPAASEEDSDSDSEDAQSVVGDDAKKDVKSAGSMAFMVLLFSLSSLLTSAESPSSAKPAERVRRPGMHHRDSSRTYLDLPVQQQQFASGLSYDSFLSTSDAMLGAPAFFDEDNLLGGSSAFAGLGRPQQQQTRKESAVADSLASAISSVKSISPQEFEFDFTVPESSESLDSFTFPAKKQAATTSEAGKKIRVCVKSALPLNLNLDALSKAASSTSNPASAAPAPAASSMAMTNDLFASSFGYRVPETDDLLLNTGLWTTSPTVASASPTLLSPTTMMMSPSAGVESRKRKRVVVEINPRGGAQRRRLSSDVTLAGDAADTWDVKFSSEDGALFDEDVQMRL